MRFAGAGTVSGACDTVNLGRPSEKLWKAVPAAHKSRKIRLLTAYPQAVC